MTKLNRQLVGMLVMVLLVPMSTHAASIEAKSIELDMRFSFQNNSISVETPFGDEDFGLTVLDVKAGAGYFFNPNWELAGYLLVNHTSIEDFGFTDLGLQANGYYHFNTSGSVIPFVGLGLGFVVHGGDVDDDEDNSTLIVPELVAGLRWPFRDVVALNLSGGYRHEESPLGLEDGSGDEFFLAFGFSFFLEGGAAR
jgi:hypothetical protein